MISFKIHRNFDNGFKNEGRVPILEIYQKIATLDLGKRLRIDWLTT